MYDCLGTYLFLIKLNMMTMLVIKKSSQSNNLVKVRLIYLCIMYKMLLIDICAPNILAISRHISQNLRSAIFKAQNIIVFTTIVSLNQNNHERYS